MTDFDDVQLMRRVQQGDFGPFETLVARYRGPLLHAAWSKLGDSQWAEDVVQEAFLAAFAARHTYDPSFSFRTWLWTILLNLCRKQYKRREERPREIHVSPLTPVDALPFAEPATYESGLSRLLCAERKEELALCLAKLPEVQADALRLRFFGGLKFSEIAHVMDSSESAAKVRVRNGLAALALLLDADEGAHS